MIGCAVAEIGEADIVIILVLVGEGEVCFERYLCVDDVVIAEEVLLVAEYVY